ncbi:MAG: LPS export ABC transporter permease LptG [Hyphomicrobiaceae bacterium]
MMLPGRLWRYVAGKFALGILLVYLLCFVIILMVDMVELLRISGKTGGVPLASLIGIALLRVPSFAELTLPFAALAGSIGALLMLARSSELVVIRASGMSVWQFIMPGVVVAFVIGLAANYLYNPLAATARARAETFQADLFGREQSLLKTKNAGSWLRQDGIDGPSLISAGLAADRGLSLVDVSAIQFDRDNAFVEHIDAEKARLRDGFWELEDAWVSRVGQKPEHFSRYQLPTHLTPAEAGDALGSVYALSFYELPAAIALAERAGLKATRYKVQYELMKSRPLLLAAMVILAATVSLRAFRLGKIQTKVILGLMAGFGFFIVAEASRQIGVSGLTAPWVAAWVPTAVASLLSLTVLLHQEDG